MQRNDPAGAVELPSFTAQANPHMPALSLTVQDLTADPGLQAAAKMALPALVFSVDQDEVTWLKKRNAALEQQRKAAAGLLKRYFFSLLPKDVQEKLVDYGAERPLVHLSLFQQALELKVATNEAVLAVLQGDLPKAEVLAQQRPALLTRKGTASDYSRRTFGNITPFQAALCAWDNETCDMLKNYMLPEEVKRQYTEIFPNGHAAHCAAQKPYDFSALVDAITHSPEEDIKAALNKQENNTSLCQIVNEFRVNFTALSQQEIIFNPQHFIKACEIYNERYNGWNWDQRDLFWRQVIGYVQRFLPANLAQDAAQGLYFRMGEGEPAKRSLKFRKGGGALFPLDFKTHSGLGFDYACGSGGEALGRGQGGAAGHHVMILCQTKAEHLSAAYFARTELPRVARGFDLVK